MSSSDSDVQENVVIVKPKVKFTSVYEGGQDDFDIPVDYDQYGNPSELVIKILDPSHEVGDIFADLPHRTSAWANMASDLIVIDKFDFQNFIKDYEFKQFQNNTKFLRGIPCLFGLSNKRLRQTIEHCNFISCNWNTQIIKEGEPCKHIFIVCNGELKVTKITQEDKPEFTNNPTEIFQNL